MKRILLILLLALGAVACNTKQAPNDSNDIISNKEAVDLMKQYPELAEQIGKMQSTPSDNYFKLTIATDSTCKIE